MIRDIAKYVLLGILMLGALGMIYLAHKTANEPNIFSNQINHINRINQTEETQ